MWPIILVCFSPTKMIGMMKIHFWHYLWKCSPWYWIPPYLFWRDRSAAAQRCACYLINIPTAQLWLNSTICPPLWLNSAICLQFEINPSMICLCVQLSEESGLGSESMSSSVTCAVDQSQTRTEDSAIWEKALTEPRSQHYTWEWIG